MNPESPQAPFGMQPQNGMPSGAAPQGMPSEAPQPAGYTPLPPVNTPPLAVRPSKKWLIIAIVFIFTTLVGGGLATWALINYFDQKNNVDSKVTAAVATAVKDEQDKAAAHLLEVENNPNRMFAGPDDYGHLTFNYSKLWSVYVDKDARNGGTYTAYLNPVEVPPISSSERYALRVTIEEKEYDKVLSTYKSLVDRGDLQSSAFKIDETTSGTRLDGNFTKDIRGSAVIFKIRDKTVTLRTDAETFKEQFDALIQTIEFNK